MEEVVNGWKTHLGEDVAKYGSILQKIEVQETEAVGPSGLHFQVWIREFCFATVLRVKWQTLASRIPKFFFRFPLSEFQIVILPDTLPSADR